MDLFGKRILFIAPQFFGCDKLIFSELCEQGAIVTRLYDRPFSGIFFKALCRFLPRAVSWALTGYYKRKVRSLNVGFDHVFVINGQTLHYSFLVWMRRRFPSANFILYMWDSLENRPYTVQCLSLYDRRLSFDPLCCERFGLVFRPLFFVGGSVEGDSSGGANVGDRSACDPSESDYDIAFVGTVHSDRYEVLQRLRAHNPGLRIRTFLYMQSKFLFYFRKLFVRAFRSASANEFMFRPLLLDEVDMVLSRSAILLDIEHPKQRGLTIRSVDYLRAGKKFITTNRSFVSLKIFETGNILLLDRDTPIIDREFFDRSFSPFSTSDLDQFTIKRFLSDCFV